jgi:hypothetical protein
MRWYESSRIFEWELSTNSSVILVTFSFAVKNKVGDFFWSKLEEREREQQKEAERAINKLVLLVCLSGFYKNRKK